ncbi:MAG: uracil-DNA glycosylase [Deltaproteobacteria bacterium HGW-Deltaproteobacteria-21]|nr:MAG: uracil-DNA glycosylase [Deltaproteobacteria bacterium HGW-Deltaproteobacteria-21]
MVKKETRSAKPFVPEGADLAKLRKAVQGCRGCELYRNATQAVFGEGPEKARIVMAGEKPGDREDIEGKPFVGPAGKMLHKAMLEAGIDPEEVYITNAVKHFKFEKRGAKRLHKKPSGPEIAACRPWLDAELDLIKPSIIVCLGATAARTLMGKEARVTKIRGELLKHEAARYITATIHPSALLRMPEEERRHEEYRLFVEDLRKVREKLTEGS